MLTPDSSDCWKQFVEMMQSNYTHASVGFATVYFTDRAGIAQSV
jgi:hypothetical protein